MVYVGEKKREYQREWIAARRTNWFQDKVCVICKGSDRLELDHIDPTKKVSSRIWSWSEVKRDIEIAKCQILCFTCHKKKTRKDREAPHGSNNRYTSPVWRCRCALCKKAHAAVNAKYRSKGL